MTGFWLPALLLGALAAAFVLYPLLRSGRRDGDLALRQASNLAIFEDRLAEIRADRAAGEIDAGEAEALEAELKRSLLRDADPEAPVAAPATPDGRALLWGAALCVPLLAIVLYADWGLSFGALADLELAEEVRRADAASAAGEAGSGEMRALAVRLAARLEASPDDPDGWFLLGRTRLQLGDYEAAADAFGEVVARAPESLAPRVFQAQALYLADDRTVTDRVRALVDAVLALDPEQPMMLELLAMDAFRDRRFAEASDLFARVLGSGVEDEARRRFLEDGLARARALAGLPPAPVPAPGPGGGETADGPAIDVEVALSETALAGLPPSAVVFVLARAPDGPPMPLAVERLAPAPRLAVELTVEDAMAPALSLAGVDAVEVVARLSMAGTPARGPDDLEAVVGPVAPADRPRVTLRLDPAGSGGRVTAAAAPATSPPARTSGSTASSPEAPVRAARGVSIPVLVELAEGLVPAPDATVFVFAREVGGPPMPLVVARLTAAELPTVVTLDDSMAMMPGRGLAAAERVELVARVTRSGGVSAAPGDLEGSAGPVTPAAAGRVVPLLIDRVVE